MKTLLQKIKTEIQAIEGVRDIDVYLSVDSGIVPERVKFPCIGIKDGAVERSELMSECVEETFEVDIHIYQRLLKGEDEVETILDIAEKIHDALTENYLDGYIKGVTGEKETPIQVMYKSGMDALILRKTLSYQYQKEV